MLRIVNAGTNLLGRGTDYVTGYNELVVPAEQTGCVIVRKAKVSGLVAARRQAIFLMGTRTFRVTCPVGKGPRAFLFGKNWVMETPAGHSAMVT